jgi:hypothetical protein
MSLARQSHSKMERLGNIMNYHPHPHQSSKQYNCPTQKLSRAAKKQTQTKTKKKALTITLALKL